MQKATVLLIPALLLSGLAQVSHGKLFSWVDDDGNVHYSDSLPPEQAQSSHTELTDKGARIKSVPRAKTPEEVQKEKELERMRAEQEKLLEKQREADDTLLRTFHSEDDILMARDGKIAAIDVTIDVTKNNIARLQERLEKLLAEAADLERAGKPVAQHRSENISQTVQAIGNEYATIVEREKQKDSIRAKLGKDMARFRQLKNLPLSESVLPAQDSRPSLHNIVDCADQAECDMLWEKATDYVRRSSTTAVQTSNSLIFITAPPATEQDISLILSRIDDETRPGAYLFLDLRCNRSVAGKQLCKGEKAQSILQGFRPALLGEGAPPP